MKARLLQCTLVLVAVGLATLDYHRWAGAAAGTAIALMLASRWA